VRTTYDPALLNTVTFAISNVVTALATWRVSRRNNTSEFKDELLQEIEFLREKLKDVESENRGLIRRLSRESDVRRSDHQEK
jgi:cytochrome oxidase assembly protein ShyY1